MRLEIAIWIYGWERVHEMETPPPRERPATEFSQRHQHADGIVVVPFSRFEALREKPGLKYPEANRHGKVVYES